MADNPYHYTVEKLTNALEVLATHPGDARERVAAAYLCCFTLQEDDFPAEHQAKWRSLVAELDRFPPDQRVDGTLLNSSLDVWARKVRTSTGEKMAKLLWELYWSVSLNRQYE